MRTWRGSSCPRRPVSDARRRDAAGAGALGVRRLGAAPADERSQQEASEAATRTLSRRTARVRTAWACRRREACSRCRGRAGRRAAHAPRTLWAAALEVAARRRSALRLERSRRLRGTLEESGWCTGGAERCVRLELTQFWNERRCLLLYSESKMSSRERALSRQYWRRESWREEGLQQHKPLVRPVLNCSRQR